MKSRYSVIVIAVISALISVVFWHVNEERKFEARGALIEKAKQECMADIEFLNGDSHAGIAGGDAFDKGMKSLNTLEGILSNRHLEYLLGSPGAVSPGNWDFLKSLVASIESYNTGRTRDTSLNEKKQLISDLQKCLKQLEAANSHDNVF